MYIDRMKRLRAFIAEVPASKIKMKDWLEIDLLDNKIPSQKVMIEKSCGTVGCIAGWAAVCFGILPRIVHCTYNNTYLVDEFPLNKVVSHLGLSRDELTSLFKLVLPQWLLPASISSEAFDSFDALPSAKRKAAILQTLDYIIQYGFTWLSEDEKSPRIQRFLKAS